jgi:hypothetical protein
MAKIGAIEKQAGHRTMPSTEINVFEILQIPGIE